MWVDAPHVNKKATKMKYRHFEVPMFLNRAEMCGFFVYLKNFAILDNICHRSDEDPDQVKNVKINLEIKK